MMEQRTPEWYAARLGKVTASALDKVMASGKGGKPSATRETYMAELLAERFSGKSQEKFRSAAIDWGTETEPMARMSYEIQTGNVVTETGLVDHPDIIGFGASPDGLVNSAGLLEIKCPETKKHLETIQTGIIDREYMLQMHGQMLCTGRIWCDFQSFDPRLPDPADSAIIRVVFNKVLGQEILDAVEAFLVELDGKCTALIHKFPSLAANYSKWFTAAFPKLEPVMVKGKRSLF